MTERPLRVVEDAEDTELVVYLFGISIISSLIFLLLHTIYFNFIHIILFCLECLTGLLLMIVQALQTELFIL